MLKLMYISTSHNKVIYAATIVQCAASYKWLPPGRGRLTRFLRGWLTHGQSAMRVSFVILNDLYLMQTLYYGINKYISFSI